MAVPPKKSEPHNKLENYKKYLVAEQPGWGMSITGILLALFMGLAIKAALSPARVLSIVRQTAQKVDPRFTIQIGDAYVSLSDGFFPEIAVVIKNLTMESEEFCWMRPSLEVDEVKLPLDIVKFFGGKIYTHEIYANQASISLRSDFKKCRNVGSIENHAGNFRSIAAQEENLWSHLQEIPSLIDSLYINRLRVHYIPLVFTSFEVQKIEVNLKSQSPQKISANGILKLAGETLSGDYASTSFLKFDYDETRIPAWKAELDGNWREGNYAFQLSYHPASQDTQFTVNMSHIPLNQLLPLLRKYRLLSVDFNGRQVWLTLRSEFKGKVPKLKTTPIKIDYAKLEGNIGEVEARNIDVQKLEPLSFKPLDVDIKSLDLDALLTFLNRPHPNAALGHLGVFHGKAHVQNIDDVTLNGEHSGLEFIFSSRGMRQTQLISLMSEKIQFRNQKWQMNIDQLKPNEGIFLGDISVEASKDWKNVLMHVKLDDLTLSQPVQKLITNGGVIDTMSGNLFFKFKGGELADLNGNFASSGLVVDKVSVKRSQVSVTTQGQEILLDMHAQGVNVSPDSESYRMISNLIDLKSSEVSEISMASALIRTHMLQDFSWENVVLNFKKHQIRMRGGWNDQGELRGDLELKGPDGKKIYQLVGNRDHPQMVLK